MFLSRALALYCLGRYAEAKADIEKCISLQPYSLKPLLVRSIINTGLRDYDSALGDADYCIEKAPAWADAYHQRGLIYLSMKKYPEALDSFESAISNADESKPEYYSDRGFAQYFLQDYEKAKADFLHSLKAAENDNVYLCMIDVCYKLEQYEEGLKYADILIKKGSRVDSAIIERSYLYLALGQYDDAKKDLDLLAPAADGLSSYHKVLCIYYILTGEKNSADIEIDKAYKLKQDDSEILLLKKLLQENSADGRKILKAITGFRFEL